MFGEIGLRQPVVPGEPVPADRLAGQGQCQQCGAVHSATAAGASRLLGTRPGPLGAIGVTGSLALALLPLVLGRGEGWPAWTWISLAASVPVLGLVVHWQRFLHARAGTPLGDVTLFRSRSYRAGIGAIVAFMAYFASLMFTLTLLLQGGRDLTALQAGLVFAPMGALFCIAALLGPQLLRRYGPMVTVYGGGVSGASIDSTRRFFVRKSCMACI